MAISEDASTPAVATLSASTSASTLASASFTPPSGSWVIVEVAVSYGANLGSAPTLSISDSLSGTWTSGPTQVENVSGTGSCNGVAFFTQFFAASPGAMTVTGHTSVAGTASIKVDLMVAARVMDGVAVSQSGAGSAHTGGTTAVTTFESSITTTAVGSRVYVGASSGAQGTYTPSAKTTTVDAVQETTTSNVNAIGKQTTDTTTPGATTLGWTGTSASWAWAALELLPSTGTAVTAGLAVGSGTVQAPAAVPAVNPTAGLAAGTGTAFAAAPAIGVAAGLATGMDAAQAPAALPAVNPAAGLATGTGTALTAPLANVAPATATGTGTAKAPTAAVAVNPAAGLATGTGVAYNASTAGSTNVSAGLAHGTGTAQNPASIGVVFTAQTVQFPTVFAQDATVTTNVPVTAGLATGTGTAQAAAPAVGITAGLATGADAALAAAPADGVTAGLATATGTARSTAVVLTAATGTGTAQAPASTAIVFTAGFAHGTGTAQTVRPSTISPTLEGYGFGTFPQVPSDSVILSVVADIVWFGSDVSILQPSYELWDGTSARIGSPQQGVASDTPGNRDSIVFTGVTYAQLATLRLRMTAGTAAGNSGATVSVDAMSLSVTWAPGQTATIAPAVLAIVPAFPAPAVSGVVNASVTPDPMAVVPQFPAPAAGFEQALVFPAVLAAAIVIPAAAAAAGTTVTPGVLALAPAFPAITDITAPGWASADDIPVSGAGTWVNPGNIIGPPDGSNAVWTVP